MELLTYLQSVIDKGEGYVQVQLAKEDLARIQKLIEIADTVSTQDEMIKAGLYIGWTKGDFRTHELHEPLKHLLRSIFEYEKGEKSAKQDKLIMTHWADFHLLRMKTLIHCL